MKNILKTIALAAITTAIVNKLMLKNNTNNDVILVGNHLFVKQEDGTTLCRYLG